MPQKKKQNAFMVFVMEWKENNAPGISIPDAISRVGSIWKRLSEDQKSVYKERARNSPKLPDSNRKSKLACDGTPIDLIEKQQREAQQQVELMNNTIKDTIKKALNSNNLINQRFFFLMCNHFVRVLHTDDYIPAEIALVEFSLKTGVNNKLHAFVNPQQEFFGNVYEAQHHADTTHQLPLPPEAFGDKSLDEIFKDILDFIYDKELDAYPPLYTAERFMPIVKSSLQFLTSENDQSVNLEIYSIEQLFYELKCATIEYGGSGKALKNKFISNLELDRDVFKYEANIACEYHEAIDRGHYCALSQVMRWAFTFADYTGIGLNLTFISGKHMPDRYDAEKVNRQMQEKAKSDTASIQSASDAISQLSLESDYRTCDDTASVRSHNTTVNHKPILHAQPQNPQRKASLLPMPDIASSTNLWKRHDTSQPPDSHFFDIDYEEPQTTDITTRRSYGRGIAILDDDFPSLGTNGRGRKPHRV